MTRMTSTSDFWVGWIEGKDVVHGTWDAVWEELDHLAKLDGRFDRAQSVRVRLVRD